MQQANSLRQKLPKFIQVEKTSYVTGEKSQVFITNGLQANLSFALEETISYFHHHPYLPRLIIQEYF